MSVIKVSQLRLPIQDLIKPEKVLNRLSIYALNPVLKGLKGASTSLRKFLLGNLKG